MNTETEIVLGPPGTGKTTYLLEQMERELARNVAPGRFALVSFTRRAATEAKERAMAKFGLTDKDLPWVSTLHSMCFRSLGLKREQVFAGAEVLKFAKWAGIDISRWDIDEDETGPKYGDRMGDRCLFHDHMARVREVPLWQQHDESGDRLTYDEVARVVEDLRRYKKALGLIDFADMLGMFIERGGASVVQPEVLIVDEAQDLSMAQWRVVEALAPWARRVIVAGDDDQAIYGWAGAAVQHFVDMPGKVTRLTQSWRVPPEVQRMALAIVEGIGSRRRKDWNPREGTGKIAYVPGMDDAGVDGNEETLVLARNSCFLHRPVIPTLRSQGVLFEYQGERSLRQTLVDAVIHWEHLRKGGSITVAQAENVYAQMHGGTGYAPDHRKLPAWPDREQMVGMRDLREAGGLLATSVWYEALTRMDAAERLYMRNVLKHGQKLTGGPPKVRLSTIHGSKGAQADHVVLLTDMARRSLQQAKVAEDDEARCWYVAVTRAKKRLTIVAARNHVKAYPLP